MLLARGLLDVKELHPARCGQLVKEIMRRETGNE